MCRARELPSKRRDLTVVTEQLDLSGDLNAVNPATYSTKSSASIARCETKQFHNAWTNDSAVCTRIDKKQHLLPSATDIEHFAADNRPHDAVVAFIPLSVDAHRCGGFFPWECNV